MRRNWSSEGNGSHSSGEQLRQIGWTGKLMLESLQEVCNAAGRQRRKDMDGFICSMLYNNLAKVQVRQMSLKLVGQSDSNSNKNRMLSKKCDRYAAVLSHKTLEEQGSKA